MKRRYDEIMDRIEVTDEMRSRILGNLQKMDFADTAGSGAVRIPNIRRYLSAAACFAVLLAGVFAAGHMAGIFRPYEPNTAIVNGIVEVDTLEQLADAVGFEVEELTALPFAVEETAYVSYWDELAEITYSGENQTATFRKSAGTGDNSGDYNTYSAVKELHAGPLTATLKGEGEVYTLAIWPLDGYAYSICLSNGISEAEWYRLICDSLL